MAPEIAPDSEEQTMPLNTLEVRFTGGMLALNRFLMTLQNKRMPVAGFTLGRDGDGMRATILLDCAPEMARRYTMLLSALEDVYEVTPVDEGIEVALVKTNGDWGAVGGAKRHTRRTRATGTVVASGRSEELENWLSELGDEVEDIVRLGPMVRPGNGGV